MRPLVQGSLCQPHGESKEAATLLSAGKETQGARLSPSFSNNVSYFTCRPASSSTSSRQPSHPILTPQGLPSPESVPHET